MQRKWVNWARYFEEQERVDLKDESISIEECGRIVDCASAYNVDVFRPDNPKSAKELVSIAKAREERRQRLIGSVSRRWQKRIRREYEERVRARGQERHRLSGLELKPGFVAALLDERHPHHSHALEVWAGREGW